MDDPILLEPAFFLISGATECFRCGTSFEAVAIAASLIEGGSAEDCLLSFVTDLPAEVLAYIQQRFPNYSLKRSDTAELSYYANSCPGCGVIAGDFPLRRPGHVFWPMNTAAAMLLNVEQIPVEHPISVAAETDCGSFIALILREGHRIDTPAREARE